MRRVVSPPSTLLLSDAGRALASPSGLRRIMEDAAAIIAGSSGTEQWMNLGIGNPADIPEVQQCWRQLAIDTVADAFDDAVGAYGPSRGHPELLDALVRYFNQRLGWDLTAENVLIGPGSQMLCFIAAMLFTGPRAGVINRLVLPSLPDYAGYLGLTTHPETLVGILPRVHTRGAHGFSYEVDFEALETVERVGLLMTSTPANPTGRCLTSDELATLAETAARKDAVLLVDNAYGEPFPRVGQASTQPRTDPHVINAFSVSKAGLPGARLGIAIGPEAHISAMTGHLANSALQAPGLEQLILARALETGALERLATSVIPTFYAARRGLAEALLTDSFPDGIRWRLHDAVGGMFCWLWVDEPWFDDLEFFERLKERRVMVVPGRSFFPSVTHGVWDHARRCLRISLTQPEAKLEEGILRLVEALVEMRTQA